MLAASDDAPVVKLPIDDIYQSKGADSTFAIAIGTLLTYNNKRSNIDLISEHNREEVAQEHRKKFFLAIFFGILTISLFTINILMSSLKISSINTNIESHLAQIYTKNFKKRKIKISPLADARKYLRIKKKEVDTIENILEETTE